MFSCLRKPELVPCTRLLRVGDRIDHTFFGTLLILDEPIVSSRVPNHGEAIVYNEFHALVERSGDVLWFRISRIRWVD